MKIKFKLYASLMKYLPEDAEGHAFEILVTDKTTVQDIIDDHSISDKEAYLVMLNGVYLAPEQRRTTRLKDRDELALWPKVAGG